MAGINLNGLIRLLPDPATQGRMARMLDWFDNLPLEGPGQANVDAIADSVQEGFAAAFQNEGSGSGTWAALRPRTVKDRLRRGFPGEHPILVRTGLYRSRWIERGSVDHVQEFQPTQIGWFLRVGSQDYRAKWHEEGTARMPARPVRDLRDEDVDRIGRTIDWVMEQIVPKE